MKVKAHAICMYMYGHCTERGVCVVTFAFHCGNEGNSKPKPFANQSQLHYRKRRELQQLQSNETSDSHIKGRPQFGCPHHTIQRLFDVFSFQTISASFQSCVSFLGHKDFVSYAKPLIGIISWVNFICILLSHTFLRSTTYTYIHNVGYTCTQTLIRGAHTQYYVYSYEIYSIMHTNDKSFTAPQETWQPVHGPADGQMAWQATIGLPVVKHAVTMM